MPGTTQSAQGWYSKESLIDVDVLVTLLDNYDLTLANLQPSTITVAWSVINVATSPL